MNKSRVLIASTIVAASLAGGATTATAQAQNVVCNGSLGAITVDNLEVPEFGRCTLNGTIVLGSIDVEPGGRLSATAVSVSGNVQATEATSVVVSSSTIAGSYQVVQGGVARLNRSTVRGDVLVDGQSGAVAINNNRIGIGVAGNVEVFANTGGTTITANLVRGNLQCKDNLPAPTGSRNVVAGNKEDQCALL